MTITVQEKQDLIDAKDWDALIETDIFLDFNYGVHTFKQYTFDRDFVMSFVFNVDRFIAHVTHIAQFNAPGTKNPYNNDIFQNTLLRCADLGVKLSTDDWKDVINTVSILYSNDIIGGRAASQVTDITGKDADYLRVLLDPKMVSKLSLLPLVAYGNNRLNAEEFSKLTPDEQHIVAPLLTYNIDNVVIRIVNGDARIFASAVKDYKDLITISRKLRIRVSSILADLEPDEYIKILLDLIHRGESVNAETWLHYFSEHPDYEIDDEQQFKSLFNKFGREMFMYMINNVSEKVIEENIKTIPNGYLINRQSMSLQRISELLRHAKTDMSEYGRFFTDEEIAQYPHFFNPRVLSRRKLCYVSRETFKILNKTWGLRQQYDTGLEDFETIVRSMPSRVLTVKTLRYLKEKTKASNEVVSSTILGRYIDSAWSKDAKKLSIVKEFLNKFRQ